MLAHFGGASSERRELAKQVWVAQLHHPLWAGQIAKWGRAKVDHPSPVRKTVDYEILSRRGQNRLTPVREIA
jgi:hypothetical protein